MKEKHTPLVLIAFLVVAANAPVAVLLIGSPGAGKSYVGNYLCGRNLFRSGTAMERVTTQFQHCTVQGGELLIYDVPGLLDSKKHLEQNKIEIQNALSQNKDYLVVYIMTLEGMRVRWQDIVTMKAILQAYMLEPDQFMILLNKVPEDMSTEQLAAYMALVSSQLEAEEVPLKVSMATYIKDNEPPKEFLPRVLNALDIMSPKYIDSKDVKRIQMDAEKLEEMLTQESEKTKILAHQLSEIQKSNDALQGEIESLKRKKRHWLDKVGDFIVKVAETIVKEYL